MNHFQCFFFFISRPDTVAEHVLMLLKDGENGTIWISDNDELRLVDMHSYYNFD